MTETLLEERLQVYPPSKVPETVEQLALTIGASLPHDVLTYGYGMFWCMQGLPRSFMEVPIVLDDKIEIARFIYHVVGFESKHSREAAEPKLVNAMYQFLLTRRLDLVGKGNDHTPPLMLIRRALELNVDFECNRTTLSFRIAIPGVDLQPYDAWPWKTTLPVYTKVD